MDNRGYFFEEDGFEEDSSDTEAFEVTGSQLKDQAKETIEHYRFVPSENFKSYFLDETNYLGEADINMLLASALYLHYYRSSGDLEGLSEKFNIAYYVMKKGSPQAQNIFYFMLDSLDRETAIAVSEMYLCSEDIFVGIEILNYLGEHELALETLISERETLKRGYRELQCYKDLGESVIENLLQEHFSSDINMAGEGIDFAVKEALNSISSSIKKFEDAIQNLRELGFKSDNTED